MKSSAPLFAIGLRWLLFPLCLLLCHTLSAAITLTVTPSTISNTYSGNITLQIGGLNSGEAVVIQKYTDANTNGVIDAADWLIQQFRITDGSASVIGGITNINVPHDVTSADGAITAPMSILLGGIGQQLVGSYLYKLSSPSGRFAPITNEFSVTNVWYTQFFAGTVRNSGTNVPNAGILVFTPSPDGEGLGTPIAGTVASKSGDYAIRVPAGTYLLLAFQHGYVAEIQTSPMLTLSAGATIATNLNLVPGTRTISGRAVDAVNSSIGLSGILAAWSSNEGRLAVGFTDANGNFTSSVTAGQWQFGGDDAPFAVLGYLQLDDWPVVNTTVGNVSNVIIAAPKGTALFHGRVKDDQDRPMPGVILFGRNNRGNGPHTSSGTTDRDGNYAMAINAGVWAIELDADYSGYGNYIFSPGRSADFTITDGQVQRQDFIAILATNHITGTVKDNLNNPIVGVHVFANATIQGNNFSTQDATTDGNGSYTLSVANGTWHVAVSCGCSDCDSHLNHKGFQCVTDQQVTIFGNTGVANFTAQPFVPLQISTQSLPNGIRDALYNQQFAASGGKSPYHWYLPGGTVTLPPGTLSLSGDGILSGIPSTVGTFSFWVGVYDSGSGSTVVTQMLTMTVQVPSLPLQVTTTSLPSGSYDVFYSQPVNASGGQQPYNWSLAPGSAPLPSGLNISSGGTISGTPKSSGTFFLYVRVTDGLSATADGLLSIFIATPALQVATLSLPDAQQGTAYAAQLQGAGGQMPYSWSIAPGSLGLPPNLNLSTSGVISGTPATNGTFFFIVRVTGANSTFANRPLALTIIPKSTTPATLAALYRTDDQFQIRLTGASG